MDSERFTQFSRDQWIGAPPALSPRTHALFTDIDGTLVDIEERPEIVQADEALCTTLRALGQRMDGAIAAVTGRPAAEASALLVAALPCIAGLHGREIQRAGVIDVAFDATLLDGARQALAERLSSEAPDVRIEDKGAGIALHYRHTPEQEPAVRELARAIGAAHELDVLDGKMVVELLAPGASKGGAVRSLMQEAPFAGRTPVALGDDITDEDAFVAAAALGGFGILVGPPRATHAHFRLADVASVRLWLETGTRA